MNRNIIIPVLSLMILVAAGATARGQQVREDLRIAGAGLVSYGIVETAKGDIPSSVAYYRAGGTHPEMHWNRIETSPGKYNFRPFLDALEEGRRKGVKIGIRIMSANPHGRVFPGWIKSRSVKKEGRTTVVPDWDDPGVQQSVRNLLVALGQQVRNHPAFMFADIGVVGFVGEWHTEWGPYKNSDLMPTIASQKKYVDFHVQAFGADRLVTNLGMDTEVLAYSMSVGTNGWRQDGFGSTVKFMTEYPPQFRDVPALWDVTGPRFFEIWGGNMNEWPNKVVNWSIDEIFDEALKYRCNLYANMGASIPPKFLAAYKRFHRSMMDYAIR